MWPVLAVRTGYCSPRVRISVHRELKLRPGVDAGQGALAGLIHPEVDVGQRNLPILILRVDP